MTYVVTGVTGNTGAVVADTLLSRGHKIRVVVRDASKGAAFAARGAEVAVADLTDPAALARALEGAEGAYLLVPPNMAVQDFVAYQKQAAEALAAAARAAALPHAVLLSSIGAQHSSGNGPIAGLHVAEAALRALPNTRSSFIRAAYFMENLGGSLGMLGEGLLPSFTPAPFAFEMVATLDIGKLAAELLLEGTAETQVIELSGPAQVSMADVAAALTALTGKPVQVAEAPLDSIVSTFTGFGMPVQLAELYREMTAGILNGHVDFEDGHRRVRGKTPVEAVLKQLLRL